MSIVDFKIVLTANVKKTVTKGFLSTKLDWEPSTYIDVFAEVKDMTTMAMEKVVIFQGLAPLSSSKYHKTYILSSENAHKVHENIMILLSRLSSQGWKVSKFLRDWSLDEGNELRASEFMLMVYQKEHSAYETYYERVELDGFIRQEIFKYVFPKK